MSNLSSQWVALSNGELAAEIDPLGAQLSVLRDRLGRDLLWNGDPAVWSGRAPLLFPIVGTLVDGAYRLGSTSYKLPRHGLARTRRFELLEASATAATFRLQADASSIEVYPFLFVLTVSFVLQGSTLIVTTTVLNAGEAVMPASFGYHPAFRWPLPFGEPRAAHYIDFEQDEPAPVRRLDAAGLATPDAHPTPVTGRRLMLEDSLFTSDVVILDQVRSRSVSYGAANGPRIEVSFPDSPYLGFWAKPNAGFICIEPWHGVADPAGFAGDFTAKPGVFSLPPGGSLPIVMRITLASG